jgi:hypothetical protein
MSGNAGRLGAPPKPQHYQRCAVLLGAGASSFAGAPTTDHLTEELLRTPYPKAVVAGGPSYRLAPRALDGAEDDSPLDSFSVPISTLMFEALNQSQGGSFLERRPDFESILHLCEELLSYSAARSRMPAVAKLRPALEWLTQPTDRWRPLFDAYALTVAKLRYMTLIATRIASTNLDTRAVPIRQLLTELAARSQIDCFTLNYDNLIDAVFLAMFGDDWTDGFGSLADQRYSMFDGRAFADTLLPFFKKRHRLGHLHGSIAFGYRSPSSASQSHSGLEIVKYASAIEAISTYSAEVTNFSVTPAREFNQAGPIISGLRKAEKMNSLPYAYYFKSFADAMLSSRCVIIAGYGGRDLHVNFWLQEMAKRRATVNIIVLSTRAGLWLLSPSAGPPTKGHIAIDVLGYSEQRDDWTQLDDAGNLWSQGNCVVSLEGLKPDGLPYLEKLVELSGLLPPVP